MLPLDVGAPAVTAVRGEPAAEREPPSAGLAFRTPLEVARDSLRDAVAAFGATVLRPAHDSQESDRAGAPRVPFGDGHASDGRVRSRERSAWEAHESAHDRVFAATMDYGRALRRAGVLLPVALVAVRATVRDATVLLSAAALAAVQRDAAQCCREAFYAH
ncbi:MAG TPA: hypothetical protein VGD56_01020 [Gemmatirosa sp.]